MKLLLEAGSGNGSTLWILIVLGVLLVVFFVFGNIKKRRNDEERKKTEENFKEGTKIVTYTGIYGTIISVRETTAGKIALIETGIDKKKSYMEIHVNAIGAIDEKVDTVYDANGNDITEQYKIDVEVPKTDDLENVNKDVEKTDFEKEKEKEEKNN